MGPSSQSRKRSAGSGFAAEIIQAREAYISGRRGIAELRARRNRACRFGNKDSRWPMLTGLRRPSPLPVRSANKSRAGGEDAASCRGRDFPESTPPPATLAGN
jgi:hypothetical protein